MGHRRAPEKRREREVEGEVEGEREREYESTRVGCHFGSSGGPWLLPDLARGQS